MSCAVVNIRSARAACRIPVWSKARRSFGRCHRMPAFSSLRECKGVAMPISIQHQRSANRTLRIVCPNGHLGFAPIKTGSFEIGVGCEPDLICADSGSCDIGPGPLGADISSSPLAWQTHDLEHMLLASRRLGVPMIIGSAGDTGTNSRVDLFVRIIQDLARKHALPGFRVGWFHSEVPRHVLEQHMAAGEAIAGLDDRAGARCRHSGSNGPYRRGGRRASLHRIA